MIRITLKDIAEKAGVSVMTVSSALRGTGRLSEATRAKVKRIAEEMGYVPDPALSALISHKIDKMRVKANSELAFLTNYDSEDGWRDEKYVSRYYEGAKKRAEELGYSVQIYWMGAKDMSPARMRKIFEARSVQGILVAPVPEKSKVVNFAWDQFCAVALSRNLVWPKINVVDHNHFHSMKLAWSELNRRAYKRVGYAVWKESEDMSDHHWLGSHLLQQRFMAEKGESQFVESLVLENFMEKDAYRAWMKREKPDVVVSPYDWHFKWLVEFGYSIPQDVGFLHLEANPSIGLSGIRQHFPQVGVVAVDLLHLEIMRSERGVPPIRQSISIDGEWMEGNSLRPPVC